MRQQKSAGLQYYKQTNKQKSSTMGVSLIAKRLWTYRSVINDDITAGHITMENVLFQVLDECSLKRQRDCYRASFSLIMTITMISVRSVPSTQLCYYMHYICQLDF